MGRKSPFKEVTNGKVMFLLSVRPLIGTERGKLRAAIVIFPTDTYDEGVLSALRTSCGGILCTAMHLLLSVKKVNLDSSQIRKGTGGLVVVPARLEKLHRL